MQLDKLLVLILAGMGWCLFRIASVHDAICFSLIVLIPVELLRRFALYMFVT